MSLKEEFIELLQTDKEFRTKVHTLLQETFSTKDDIQIVLLQIKQLREDFQNEMKQQHDQFQNEMKQQRVDMFALFERVDLKLGALGAKWGILSEQATRNGLKEIFKRKMIVEVSNWSTYDEKGIVFGVPSRVEIDIVIKNAEHWLVEYKASVQRSDVAELVRKGTLYQEKEKITPILYIISPFVDPHTKNLADRLNVILFTTD